MTDPRILRTQERVRQAALTLLGQSGYRGFTMEGVAALSGVAKSTLYRHWKTPADLLADAMAQLIVQPGKQTPFASEDSRGKVAELLRHLAQSMKDSRISACLPALVEASEHHPEIAEVLRDFSNARRRALEQVIAEGVASGHLAPGTDARLAAFLLSSPFFYRRLMLGDASSGAEVEAMVELVLPRP